ncbi:hypothetical protein GC174_17830 [bacterium]|nr:hypothetical protein [bacterium]
MACYLLLVLFAVTAVIMYLAISSLFLFVVRGLVPLLASIASDLVKGFSFVPSLAGALLGRFSNGARHAASERMFRLSAYLILGFMAAGFFWTQSVGAKHKSTDPVDQAPYTQPVTDRIKIK